MKAVLNLRRFYYPVKVSIFLIMVALIVGMVGCDAPTEGVQIRDWYDLDAVRDNVDGDFLLMNDLDSTTAGYEELAGPTANEGQGWQPVAVWPDPFTGSFDGQGFEISDLFIDRPVEDHVGLFSFVETGAVIVGLAVINADVTGNEYVGGLVGHIHDGSLSDCYSTGSVAGDTHVGGLAGESCGSASNTYSTATVTGSFEVGGLIGQNHGTISKSYSTGMVTGDEYVGGLVGWNHHGIISNSYSSSMVAGESLVGGLVGSNRASVINCYSTGTVTGLEDVGGLTGRNYRGTVNNSFWDIETSGQPTSDGGTGMNTTDMKDITIFSSVGWDIAVVDADDRSTSHIWNIINNVIYPFLSWQP
jgi:hypothetical protein